VLRPHLQAALPVLAFVVLLALAGCQRAAQHPARPKPHRTHARTTSLDVATNGDQYWLQAKEEAYKSVPELVAQDATELAKGIRFHKIIQGDTAKKDIAITFDDGPHPDYTPKLLDILKQYDVKATFFLVGEKAEQAPDLVRAEIAAGHNVGNHTYHHVNLKKIPEGSVATEIKACDDVLRHITGKRPHLFRPPGGDYNTKVVEVAEALGYTTVLWTDDPGDYASPGDKVIETRVLDRVSNGGIVLIHDGIQQTIDVLPRMLQRLKARGYRFVTMDQMMGSR